MEQEKGLTREEYLKICRNVAARNREWFIECYRDPSAQMVESEFAMDVAEQVMTEIGK